MKIFTCKSTSSSVGFWLGEWASVETRAYQRRRVGRSEEEQARSREPPDKRFSQTNMAAGSRLASTSQLTVHNHCFTDLSIISVEQNEKPEHIHGQYVVWVLFYSTDSKYNVRSPPLVAGSSELRTECSVVFVVNEPTLLNGSLEWTDLNGSLEWAIHFNSMEKSHSFERLF